MEPISLVQFITASSPHLFKYSFKVSVGTFTGCTRNECLLYNKCALHKSRKGDCRQRDPKKTVEFSSVRYMLSF